jgi:hypothetical protein
MLPPEDYENAARQAEYHIQLVIKDVIIKSGEACLSGLVARVFRGPPELQGTCMKLQVSCFELENEDEWPPDGIGRFQVESLKVGRVIEALVNNTSSGPEIALDLCTVIDTITAAPQLQIDFRPSKGTCKKTIIAFAALLLVSVLLLFFR